MIREPERHVEAFADAGADHITIHLEATNHPHRVLSFIRDRNVKAGVSIVPSTPASALSEILDILDIVLVMTVNPGFGGQKLIPRCLEKVKQLDQMRIRGSHNFLIEADGGVNRDTAGAVRAAGTDVLISGSAFFASQDPAAEIEHFRGK
jgi:ribulose-phosphate 3-epimerase